MHVKANNPFAFFIVEVYATKTKTAFTQSQKYQCNTMQITELQQNAMSSFIFSVVKT